MQVLVLCFAVFLGNWTPSSLNIGYSTSSSMSMNGGASLFSNPRLLQPSPRMGPSVQNPKVDAYSTPNSKYGVKGYMYNFLTCLFILFSQLYNIYDQQNKVHSQRKKCVLCGIYIKRGG